MMTARIHMAPSRQQPIARRVLTLLVTVLSTAALLLGCEDEVATGAAVIAPPPPPSSKSADKPAEEAVEAPSVGWVPRRNWERRKIEGRDPFYGFVDEMIAEQLRQEQLAAQQDLNEEEVLLPAQRFDVRDFQLIALVTNTAQPKALLLDPVGESHTIKKGDLIGNRNGVLVDIRRDEIHILQGELVKERVVMKLHPDTSSGIFIELR